jgi:uncharacterized OB-fold protein
MSSGGGRDEESEISDLEVFERLPSMPIDHDNVAFFRGLLARRLLVNRCQQCGRWHQPPWPICPSCWSDDVQPTEVSGDGVLHSWTLLHGGRPLAGVDYHRGYPIAVIELAEQEGLRVTATIVGCEPEELRTGMSVRLTWRERDGEPFPAFEPSASS